MSPVAVVIALYAAIFVLHLIVPGRWVAGYLVDPGTGERLRYRLNGLRVLWIVIALYLAGGALGLFPWDYLHVHRGACLATACAIGLAFTAAIVAGAPPRRGLLADLYLGRRADPRALDGHLDAKMFLYLIGAVVLQLNLLSSAAHHLLLYPGSPSPGVLLHLGLFSFFLWEYLYFEEVHLYTYDFVAERVGFKLGWGCLTFYPYFYAYGLYSTAALPGPEAPQLAPVALLFFAGWILARGANMQKFWFKTDPKRRAFGLLAPEALEAAGEGGAPRRILVNGFWGLSRHINYLGEITMAVALALSLGHPAAIGPWLYPLYYLVLLIPRQIDDDRRCAAKYGLLWEAYRRRVPWRIIPWVY
ncbi:MAG: ergosterol biosynthesis protein [Nannocystaceae bacterium]